MVGRGGVAAHEVVSPPRRRTTTTRRRSYFWSGQTPARGPLYFFNSLLVDRLLPVRRLLDASSDRDNPSAEELDELFHRMRTIAVVGISRDPLKTARRIPSYLAAKGYEIIPVNPVASRILGKDAIPSLDALTDPVDMVLLFRPSNQVGAFVIQATERPERPTIWLQEGITAETEIRAARANGICAVQDLCSYKVHRALQ
jgi:uncharacterized protein